MWNSYFNSRPRRDVPQVNYYESDEDEDPFLSPARPPVTREGSPQPLAIPQLNDNVDEDLEKVSQTLKNVGHTHTFRNTRIKKEEEEDTVEGIVVGAPVESDVKEDNVIMPDTPYDKAGGEDGEDVYKKLSTLTNKFTKSNPKFWFSNFERSIKHFGVKAQLTKMEAPINLLPPEVTEEVMSFISLDETELGATPFFDLKTELLKLYGPRPEDSFNKAISRVLVGKPSTLGKQVINDFCECKPQINCKCCSKIAFGIWQKNLPTYIKAQIFSKLDIKKAYHHVEIAKEHRHKTAVLTPWGCWQFKKMAMGLANASQSYQRYMDSVLQGLDGVYCYLDDVLIFARSEAEHIQIVEKVYRPKLGRPPVNKPVASEPVAIYASDETTRGKIRTAFKRQTLVSVQGRN